MAERPDSLRPGSPIEKGIRSMEEGELSVIDATITMILFPADCWSVPRVVGWEDQCVSASIFMSIHVSL